MCVYVGIKYMMKGHHEYMNKNQFFFCFLGFNMFIYGNYKATVKGNIIKF